MYIKKKDKELFNDIDNNLKIPNKFHQFINDKKKTQNIILKSNNNNYCTYCQIEFDDPMTKIYEKHKCPCCQQKLLVKSNRIKNYTLNDTLGVLDKYQDKYIIRYFELTGRLNKKHFEYHLCEYGRKIFDNYFYEKYEIINDNVSIGLGYSNINHNSNYNSNWRYFRSYYHNLGDCLIFYPYNIKSLLKDTKWQYSKLWKLVLHKDYLYLAELLRNYKNSIELLIKLRLYNLVDEYQRYDGKKLNFEKRFGVSKTYLSYMQKYNITSSELEVLKFLKNRKDIRLIKKYSNFNLDGLEKYNINLYELDKKTDISNDNYHEYKDYLRFAKELRYDLKDKKILYPENIKKSHDKVLKLIEVKRNKKYDDKIKKRYKQIKNNIYKNNKYIIYPVKTSSELIDESAQQNNCVKTYIERIAEGKCDIYFMRLINSMDKSLVTIEVKNNKVVQQRIKNNENTTKEQNLFLKKWERLIGVINNERNKI